MGCKHSKAKQPQSSKPTKTSSPKPTKKKETPPLPPDEWFTVLAADPTDAKPKRKGEEYKLNPLARLLSIEYRVQLDRIKVLQQSEESETKNKQEAARAKNNKGKKPQVWTHKVHHEESGNTKENHDDKESEKHVGDEEEEVNPFLFYICETKEQLLEYREKEPCGVPFSLYSVILALELFREYYDAQREKKDGVDESITIRFDYSFDSGDKETVNKLQTALDEYKNNRKLFLKNYRKKKIASSDSRQNDNVEKEVSIADAVVYVHSSCEYTVTNSYNHHCPWEMEIRLCFEN